MAVTTSKAYDLRNVQYKGTRIGGTDQITTSPIQYQGTPVPYLTYGNRNILHRYTVRNGYEYREVYRYEDDEYPDYEAGVYSVSSDSNYSLINTDVPAPEPYSDRKIQYEYYITKYELTRTSGTKNESKYYLYAFTITLRAYYYDDEDDPTTIHAKKYRIDKYDYLSTEDISLDTLAAQIEDPSGGTEGFTPPWKLDITTETILKRTRRERERTDNVGYTGNFNNFGNNSVTDEGTPSSWSSEFEDSFNNSIFNEGAEGLIVYYNDSSSSSIKRTFGNGKNFNFNTVVNLSSQIDDDHVCITGANCKDYSSCSVNGYIDVNYHVVVTDGFNVSRSSNDYSDISLIFLICSSCINNALSDGSENLSLSYYRNDCTIVNANISYDNYLSMRDY